MVDRTRRTAGALRGAVLALCLSCVAHHEALAASSDVRRPFTARDSIELPRVLNFSGVEVNAPNATALFSPDRSHFLIRTRRGDLTRNVNVETVWLFDTRQVDAYLARRDAATPPSPVVLMERSVSHDHGHIANVQWVSDSEIGFIAQSESGQNQAYLVNADTRAVTQLTRSELSVVSFALAGDSVLYYSRIAAPVLPPAVAVENQSLLELLFWNRDPEATPLQLFRSSRTTGIGDAVNVPAMRLLSASERIWMSPTGHHAVLLAPSVDAPAHWADYRVPNYDVFGYTPDKVRSDPTSWDLLDRTRYLLVDLRAGTARPLLDAPTGWHARNCTPLQAFWNEDGHSVIVSNTFLPLNTELSFEAKQERVRAPAIAEVDIRSGAVTPVVFEPHCAGKGSGGGDSSGAIVGVEWESQSSALTITRRSADDTISQARYGKSGNRWRQSGVARQRIDSAPIVERIEGLNQRPKVFATGGFCRCRKEIFDPAPEADRLRFAQSRVTTWKDQNGIVWRGALLLPPGHVEGERHPLVLQTHGFQPDEFLIDGAYGATTAMAAQALANAGISVLQVEDNRSAETNDEAALYAEGFRAALEAVVEMRIADPSKLGLVAFSRTGLPAVRLLADHPDLFAAVNLADANWWGYLQDLLLVNAPQDSVAQVLNVTGPGATAKDLPQWLARNPLYRLPTVRAAVRLEAINPSAVVGNWEYYALLRKAGRPVDLIYFPHGRHVLMKPAERLASQGGSVDWFRFWLQGYEDPDPAKVEQYQRWRRLRQQH